MKELVRSLRLNQLSNTTLTPELKRLDDAISFIQTIFDKMVLKTDDVNYPNDEFYFVNDNLYFEYDTVTSELWCRYNDFWDILEKKFNYNYDEKCDIVKVLMEEQLNGMKITPITKIWYNTVKKEEHFNKAQCTKKVTPCTSAPNDSIRIENHFSRKETISDFKLQYEYLWGKINKEK